MQKTMSPEALSGQDDAIEREKQNSILKFFSIINTLTLLLILLLAIYPDWPVGLRLALASSFLAVITVGIISSYMPILCRCILPLLIGGICVEGYILIQNADFSAQITKYFVFDDKYNEIFYSAVATLYAIITALALVKGIEDFDSMKKILPMRRIKSAPFRR